MIKNQKEILKKLQISALNPMQKEAQKVIEQQANVMLLSPTGTGKTLAFVLPLLDLLNPNDGRIQALILVPTRELAIQIEQVIKEMGSGFKVNAVYGGRRIAQDKIELKHNPAILIGTPGRVADHLRRQTISPHGIRTLILDEFDKSLEIGFEDDMTEIVASMKNLKKKILTSATKGVNIPSFLSIHQIKTVNFLGESNTQLNFKSLISPEKDKLATLFLALQHLGEQRGIVFCNFRSAIERISDYLHQQGIHHVCFHGGMDQVSREQSLIQFRNGSVRVLLATDLAARGIDVPELEFIIHYHLPTEERSYIHRNGRTARMKASGTAYVLHWAKEELPAYIGSLTPERLEPASTIESQEWTTIVINGGRRDKISKGDIAGLFYKKGQLKKEDLGQIELREREAYVAVKSSRVAQLLKLVDNEGLKKKKIRLQPL